MLDFVRHPFKKRFQLNKHILKDRYQYPQTIDYFRTKWLYNGVYFRGCNSRLFKHVEAVSVKQEEAKKERV